MKKIILREHLKEAIGNSKVKAALFHTFNFDPRFFENFVMPLFVPEEKRKFNDEEIHNKILWRYCAKENLIPPVTVFCDYYAKSSTEAPALGYEIHCIKMPALNGVISNFHPKHIFILVENDKKEESLIFITGSGNLNANGWCENFECFSILSINKNNTYPRTKNTNFLQDYILNVRRLTGLQNQSPAEMSIFNFLNYVDLKFTFFNSFSRSFKDFISNNIFSKDSINEVEIISPFFSNDNELMEFLYVKKVKKIKCLIPTLRNNEIQLEKQRFVDLEKAGLIWCFWSDKKLNEEVRNQHSKIYRFYGNSKCYTVIGSVNFTNPAWAVFKQQSNKANIESGILYIDNPTIDKLIQEPSSFNIDHFQFIEKEDLENPLDGILNVRNAPNIEFTIDWKNKVLKIAASFSKMSCHFYNMFDGIEIKSRTYDLDLNGKYLRKLSRNPLIKVSANSNDKITIYTYYANQINIETKPLDLKLNANMIIKFWQFFNDEFEKERLYRNIAEQSTDESGRIDEKKIETKLLLNQMAAHFHGLVKLEKFLFPSQINNKDVDNNFKNLKYYLISENIDTIPFYLSELKSQLEEGLIQKSFYWMVNQILINTFYAKAEKLQFRSKLEDKVWNDFKLAIKKKKLEMLVESSGVSNDIESLKPKEKWVIEQLVKNYD